MRKSNIIYHLINAAIFIALEIAALNMLKHNGVLQGIWISKGAQAVISSVWGKTQTLGDYFSLRKRNETLAQENFELRLLLAQKGIDITKTNELTYKAGKAGNFTYVPAEISKISNNTQHNYMIINKGYEQGISEGAGVITGKGAVGVIDAVHRNHSYARSFRNHEMNISARMGKEGAVGPLSWDGKSGNMAILKEIPLHVKFEPGDTVFTSGFSSIFPPDIPLGSAGASKVVNGATYEIEITLFEDFGSLRYVTIVDNLGKTEIKELEDRR